MRKLATALLTFGFLMAIPFCSTGCAVKKETHIHEERVSDNDGHEREHREVEHHHHHHGDREKVEVEVHHD